jgi:hypothetical protein
MMSAMINANFSKQDTKTSPAADPQDKDQRADDFTSLMAGLCMDPKAPEPVVNEKGEQQQPDVNTLGGPDNNTQGGVKQPVASTGGTTIAGMMGQTPIIKTPADLPQDVRTGIKPNAGTDGPTIPPRGCMLPPFEAVKPVKDLKTQLNKFEGVPQPEPSGPLANAHDLASMIKGKAAALETLGGNGLGLHDAPLSAPTGTVLSDTPLSGEGSTQDVSQLEYSYVADAVKAGELLVKDHTPRKLSKLISEVTDLPTAESGPATSTDTQPEIAQQQETRSLQKMATAMMEQVQPKMMELAAAVATEGKQVLKMRLHPAELGTVEIRLEKNDDGVLQAHLHTDNETARHILSAGIGGLRASLENAGWQVGNVEISSSLSSTGEGSTTGKNANGGRNSYSSEQDKTADDNAKGSDGPSQTSADRLVSLRA